MGEFAKPFDLDGRTAVICGGARGIGREAAVIFARAGADVVIADVDQAGLDETASLVHGEGTKAITALVNVTSKAEVDALAQLALDTFGRIDVWANVAGVLAFAPIVDTTEEELDRVIAVNLKGVYWGSAAAARAMISAGSGSIINIASAGGEVPAAGISVYALTKAAVMMFTKTLATEVGRSGVRANSVAPGFVETPMTAVHFTNEDGSIDEDRRQSILDARAKGSPLAIIGTTEDIAFAMLYLASDASKFMTGQTMRPNGGVYMG
jgi:3-oxoacyl-[acyl-carrier protein] reductase